MCMFVVFSISNTMGKLQVGVAFYQGFAEYNIGKCSETRLRGVWNPEVADVVYSMNGVQLRLSAAAQAELKSKYTGNPLQVTFLVKQKCCQAGQCSSCGCDFSQGCDFVPRIIVPVAADVIYFGKQDTKAGCDGFVAWAANLLTCGIVACGNQCFLNKAVINAAEVSLGGCYTEILGNQAPEQQIMTTSSNKVAPGK